MKKQQRASKAAFERWFEGRHGKAPTGAQIEKLYKEKEDAVRHLAAVRLKFDRAIDVAKEHVACLMAWEAAREANNE